jgi:hypothetical protein
MRVLPDVQKNYFGRIQQYSISELADKFDAGKRIVISPFNGFIAAKA